ncbi:50S ribosomal protein L15e [Candidatus Woesearchaeota archaeon]|nr:MAG: 50S ribosomal protein L15e [Candidatus Woesearchaeota archaeon]
MGLYQYLREAWKRPKEAIRSQYRERLIAWRREPVTVRITRPTRLDRARSLGYRAKQGIIVVRQRVGRGGRQRPTIRKGRRSAHFGRRKTLQKNYQAIAEERANKKFPNCEVLGSYWVADDGKNYWYEIILVDRSHPVVKKDKQLSGIAQQRGRAFRGLTSAGRKARGLRKKGTGSEKTRKKRRT